MLILRIWYFDYVCDGEREKDSGTKEHKKCMRDRENAG
jgi:hypothetical protein